MQLNIATDYAIRIVIYMAKQRRIVSSRELSENLKISQPFIYKIYQTFFLLKSPHVSKEYIHMQLTRPKIHFCILILCKYYIIYL